MEMNEILDKLPKHLLDLVVEQPYNNYTSEDHAVWRYVMRQNVQYLSKTAHGSYMEGLQKTGVEIDTIPSMYGMNRILQGIGWAAAAVDGFIPPAAFMEFQAYNVLVIAAGIRRIEHILYTPAPDIIHESAGHAPIIAEPEYAEYLRLFGEIGSKAISSALDHDIYKAVRHLSILKEAADATKEEILEAEKHLEHLGKLPAEPSEMAKIRNLHWWTVEYGLIGTMENPKIYGAGLLSSIGESVHCMKPEVKKLPYTLEAANTNFDITTMQPQLFVTPDFKTLKKVLLQFSETMAYRRGGKYAIETAIKSNYYATAIWSSGLQVSGVFTEQILDENGMPIYVKTTGETALAFNNNQLPGHDKSYHAHGFSSPVGKLKGEAKAIENFTEEEFAKHAIIVGKNCQLLFESGIEVSGTLNQILKQADKNIVFSFSHCTVTYKGKALFLPEWGTYDMAVGEQISSAYNGIADSDAWGLRFPVPEEKTRHNPESETKNELCNLYAKIRNFRKEMPSIAELNTLVSETSKFSDQWLLQLELYELCQSQNDSLALSETITKIKAGLHHLSTQNNQTKQLIDNGLKLLE